ncbi:DUF535 family protein [Rhodoblastus sp.]|uniref:DUF535 family protein n=1 Tax=Rhodoblastus sp. TaxID=1962975 RepID=UPI0035B1FE56
MKSAFLFASGEPWAGDPAFSTLGFIARFGHVRGLRPALRLAFKLACRPDDGSAWLAELDHHRVRMGLCETGLHAYAQGPLRPFLRAGWTFEQRLRVSRTHHSVVGAVLPVGAIRNIWAGRLMKLGVLEGRRGSSFALWLGAADYPREGNLQISFTRETPDGSPSLPLARLTFSLAEWTETRPLRALLIGGLQGSRHQTAKRAIIEATRDLRGLRPKAAVTLAAQAFASCANCDAVLAVADANHVANARSGNAPPQKAANYDAFWRERGGLPHASIGFELPMRREDERLVRSAISDCVASIFDRKKTLL